jgi:dolichyl-diphosphooligosaccharide--protein glycosyltransferase
VVGFAIFRVAAPALLDVVLQQFSIFTPSHVSQTTIEAQSLSVGLAWGNFTTSFFFSLIAAAIIICLVIKKGEADKTLLIVWSLIILAATLGQRRFAYYLAVNVAVLTGYLSVIAYYLVRFIIDYLRDRNTDYMSWQILELARFNEITSRAGELPRELAGRRANAKRDDTVRLRPTAPLSVGLWIIVVFCAAFLPNIKPATMVASAAQFAPSNAWISSLSWLKENTPDPFGNPDFYYEVLTEKGKYKSLSALKIKYPEPKGDPAVFYTQQKESYPYPESAYGVTAWWDYGYWIMRIAHRLPSANPGQEPWSNTTVARFFISQDEDSAREIMRELDSSYVIIDDASATSKFYAMALWAGGDPTEYHDIFYIPQETGLFPLRLFFPEYYRSICYRLYFFDGQAVEPEGAAVISYEERVSQGTPFKLITDAKEFDSYEEALAYLQSLGEGNHRLVGTTALSCPVPLEALEGFHLVHNSDEKIDGIYPQVKIFSYTD